MLNLVSVMAIEFDLQCARLSTAIQQLVKTTTTNELTMLLFKYERERSAEEIERLGVLTAADANYALGSASWHKSEAFRRHKRHGAAEEIGALREHQDSEREELDKAQTNARLRLAVPMRPEEREDAKVALAALERDEPWLDDGSLTGRRWDSVRKRLLRAILV